MLCNTNKMHETAAMWLPQFFLKGFVAVALNSRLYFKPPWSSRPLKAKEGMFRTYVEVVNYLLQTYAADYIIAKMEAITACCTLLRTMSPAQNANVVATESLRRREAYYENVLKRIFIEFRPPWVGPLEHAIALEYPRWLHNVWSALSPVIAP